jgi:hypothetical protein
MATILGTKFLGTKFLGTKFIAHTCDMSLGSLINEFSFWISTFLDAEFRRAEASERVLNK